MSEHASQASDALNDYLSQPGGPAREAWLASLRDRDPFLAEEVQSLSSFVGGGEFLDQPASPLRLEVDEDSRALAGSIVDGYELLSLIGEGGFGLVFRARRLADGNMDAVVKLLRESLLTTSARDRFEREHEVLARLRHHGIARLRSAGVLDGGTPYFIMDFVPGEPLGVFADRNKLGRNERLELVASALEALDHAHAQNVVHRDLKPSNLLAYRDANGELRVVIIDFGIAKLLIDGASAKTTTGQTLGTEAYMSPEQVRHPGRTIDAKSDVYAMGVVLAELVLGRLPLTNDDPTLLRDTILRDLPDLRPAGGFAELSPGLRAVVHRALRKEPEHRFASAGEFAAELRRILAGSPVQTKGLSRWYRARHFCSRYRGLTIAACLIVASLIAGTLVSTRYAMLAEARNRVVESQQAVTAMTGASQALRNNDRVAARALLDTVPRSGRDLRWRWLATQASPARVLARDLGQVRGFAAADTRLALGTMGGRVMGLGLNGEQLWNVEAHTRPVSSVRAFGDAGAIRFASVGADGVLCIINALDGTIEQRTQICDDQLSTLSIEPRGSKAFIGGPSGIYWLSLDSTLPAAKLPLSLGVATIAAGDDIVAIGTRDGDVIALDTNDLAPVWRVKLTDQFVMGCTWLSGTSKPLLAVTSSAGDLWLLDGETGATAGYINLESGSTNDLSWDSQGKRLLLGGRSGTVTTVSVRTQLNPPLQVESTTRSQGMSAQVRSLGSTIYSVSWSGELIAEASIGMTASLDCQVMQSEDICIDRYGNIALIQPNSVTLADLNATIAGITSTRTLGAPRAIAWLDTKGGQTLALLTDSGVSFASRKRLLFGPPENTTTVEPLWTSVPWANLPANVNATPYNFAASPKTVLAWGVDGVVSIHRDLRPPSRTLDGVVATAAVWNDDAWWMATTGGLLQRWDGEQSATKPWKLPGLPRWLGAAGDGLVALASTGDAVYRIDDGVTITVSLAKRAALHAALSEDARVLALGYADGSVDAVDLQSGSAVEVMAAQSSRAWRNLRITMDDTLLAVDQNGGIFRIPPQPISKE